MTGLAKVTFAHGGMCPVCSRFTTRRRVFSAEVQEPYGEEQVQEARDRAWAIGSQWEPDHRHRRCIEPEPV